MKPFSNLAKDFHRMSVPNHNRWPTLKKLDQDVIKFAYTSYPFPNQQINASLFNTLVQCGFSDDKLEKITNLRNDHIIQLKKIIKIKSIDKRGSIQQKKQANITKRQKKRPFVSTFSFFYQKVQFSLQYVLETKNIPYLLKQNNFKLNRAHIKKILASTIASLFRQGIIVFLQFSNIGINQKGVLKIYISPKVLIDQREYNPKTKILVIKYLNNVLRQIDSKFPKSFKSTNSKQNLKSYQLSIQNDILTSQQSFIIDHDRQQKRLGGDKNIQVKDNDYLLQNMQQSLNDQQQNFIGGSGSTNLINFKLQSQMKKRLQNHKLAEQVKANIDSQKKSIVLSKHEQKRKINEISLQLQQIRKKLRQKVQQKRQKNIYLLKGYKTMATQTKTLQNEPQIFFHPLQKNTNNNIQKFILQPPTKNNNINKKRKSSQSSINFFQGIQTNHQNNNHENNFRIQINKKNQNYNRKNLNNQEHYLKNNYNDYTLNLPKQKSYYGRTDDCMSIDTYEMEIGEDYQMPKMSLAGSMRKTLVPTQSRQQLQAKIKRQVVQNAKNNQKPRFYESMGGKRFSHIVNMLKPQFQPKRSNIFEQPQMQNQQQSKKSISMKKSIGSKHSDNSSIKKRKYQKSKLSSSESNLQRQIKGIKTLQQFKKDIQSIMTAKKKRSLTRDDQTICKQRLKNPQTQTYQNPRKYKQKSNQKFSQIFKNKIKLQQKVKNAMQRTKKAIIVLNKAKLKPGHNLIFMNGMSI